MEMMALVVDGWFICPRSRPPTRPSLSPFRTHTDRQSSSSSSPLSLSYKYNYTLIKQSRLDFHVSSSSTSIQPEPTPEIQVEIDEEASRSKLIAQNVPWSSTADDIRKLFHKYGTVVDVELSMHNKTRNRGLAFVTMSSPQEALAALQHLQSFEFEGRSLNINYARPQKKKSPPDQPKKPSVYNLFVANMSYEARSKDLRKLFEDGGWTVYTAEVIFLEDVRKSSGYGFVSFNSKEDADAALSGFQGKMFMGRSIRLARSKRFERHEAKTSGPEVVSAAN